MLVHNFQNMNFWLILMILLDLYLRQRQLKKKTKKPSLYFQFPKSVLFHYYIFFFPKKLMIPQKARGFYKLGTTRGNITLPGIKISPWLTDTYFWKGITGSQFDSYSTQISWRMLSLPSMGDFLPFKKKKKKKTF